MAHTRPTLTIHPLGESALVCTVAPPAELARQRAIWALAREAMSWPQVREALPGMNNLTLLLEPFTGESSTSGEIDTNADQQAEHGDLLAEIKALVRHTWQRLPTEKATSPAGRRIDIPVHYGGQAGPDLADVARHTGLSAQEVVRRHAGGDYTVFCVGFLPGFGFLGGMDPALATPRRTEPRTALPAGSVGIGGAQTGVYPMTSPGGWQLIGHTALALFDPQADPPTLLAPGDRVRFVVERVEA